MKEMLFTGWNFMRWLRLFIGLYIIANSIIDKTYVFALFGLLFTFQAITNTGCGLGSGSCGTPVSKEKDEVNNNNLVEYEEIK
jgi:hypothetical protein